MHYQKTAIAALILLSSSNLYAEEFRGPDTLTSEDLVAIVSIEREYASCLRTKSAEIADQHDDIRQLANVTMELCEPFVDKLEAEMADRNFDPGFIGMFKKKSVRRAVKKMLPEIMRMKAGG